MRIAVLALAAGCFHSTVDDQVEPDAAPLPKCGVQVLGGADRTAKIVLALDVDGDGIDELLVDAPSGAHLFRADGSSSVLPNISGQETKIVAGDLDGDGKLDLLLLEDGRLAITHGDGTGAFPESDQVFAIGVTDAAIADVDGDGKNEVVALIAGQVQVYYSAGKATFDAAGATWLAVGDLDGDTRPDLVVGSPGTFCIFNCDSVPGTLETMRNTGGGFGVTVPVDGLDNNSNPVFGYLADLDGDGRNDLVIASPLAGYLVRNTGDNKFASPMIAFPGSVPQALAVGDLDGDGHPEVAISGGNLDIVHGFAEGTQYALNPFQMAIGRFATGSSQLAVLQDDNSIALVDRGCLH